MTFFNRPWLDKAKDEHYWGKKITKEHIQSNDFGFKVNRGVDMPEYSNVDSCTGRVDSVKINVTYLDETYENEEKENMTTKNLLGCTTFKAGDKVVATTNHSYYVDELTQNSVTREYKWWTKGAKFVVASVGDLWVTLEGEGSVRHYTCLFELTEEKPTFKNMKFKVSSPEHSKEIQEALFEMGYKWNGHHKQSLLEYTNYSYIYTDEEGIILYGSWEPTFVQDLSEEYTLEIIKSYKIVPAEIEKLETITIDGKTYDKEAVLKRLAELESSQ